MIHTGASVNVLPYELGLQLGFIWENENLSVILAENLAHCQDRALLVEGQVTSFPRTISNPNYSKFYEAFEQRPDFIDDNGSIPF